MKSPIPASSAQDRIIQYDYDGANRLIERIDPLGVVNRLTYDAAGNVLTDTQNATGLYDSAPRVTTYTYNLANLITTQTDNKAADGEDPIGVEKVTNFEYDAVYNAIKRTVTNTWYDTLTPDAQGNPTARSEDQVTDWAYDLNNRVTDEIVAVGAIVVGELYGRSMPVVVADEQTYGAPRTGEVATITRSGEVRVEVDGRHIS